VDRTWAAIRFTAGVVEKSGIFGTAISSVRLPARWLAALDRTVAGEIRAQVPKLPGLAARLATEPAARRWRRNAASRRPGERSKPLRLMQPDGCPPVSCILSRLVVLAVRSATSPPPCNGPIRGATQLQ
jgi:hypothetical protein